MIVLPQPSDFVELLSERLLVLDSDALDFKSTNFPPLDISSLDTKLISDSGADSDDSGFHSFSDIALFSRRRSFPYDDYLLHSGVFSMDMDDASGEDDSENKDDNSDNEDGDSDSSSGSSDDDSGTSDDVDDDDDDDDDPCGELVFFFF